MGGIGGDAAAAAAVESSEADEGRSAPADADDGDGDHSSSADSTSSGDLGRETRTPLLQGPRDGPAHAEAAELEQMASKMPGQNQGSASNLGPTPQRESAYAQAVAESKGEPGDASSPDSSVRKGGAYRAAVLAHKASLHPAKQPEARRRSSSAMQRSASGLDALHEGDENGDGDDGVANEASNGDTWSAGDRPGDSRSKRGGRRVGWAALRPHHNSKRDSPTDTAADSEEDRSTGSGRSAGVVHDSLGTGNVGRAWQNAAKLATKGSMRSLGRRSSAQPGSDSDGDGSIHKRSASDIHDSISSQSMSGAKFYEMTQKAARESGGDYSNTFSKSRTLKDASQQSTASHTIPKVTGEWRIIDEKGNKVKSQEVLEMPKWCIHPFNPYYRAFLMMTVFWAALTGFVTPWVVAFQSAPGLCPYKDFPAFFEYLAALVFATDIILSFFTAYYDQEVLITDHKMIARNYLRLRFWVDIIAWLPFDYVIVEAIWPPCFVSNNARYVSLLKLLRLLRMYRVLLFFRVLEYNLVVSLLTTTMVRNFVYIIYTAHWAGCGFFFIASQEHLTESTWLGMYPDLLSAWPSKFDRYVFSFYWAITTIATVGYGDFHAASMPEAIFNLVFMLFTIGFNSYIIGTITLVVMKGDERTGHYRRCANNLKQYSKVNSVPKKLQASMQDHLRLHFNNEEASDEQVLNIYPSTIRRRILRHLYLEELRKCYLFNDCKTRFLDALLAVARVELFMPGVEILAEGDHVNELMIVVGGLVEIARPSEHVMETGKDNDISTHGGSMGGQSMTLGTRQIAGDGEALAEVAFFTEIVQMESVRSITVAKVLAVTRSHYHNVCNTFPIGARTALENLGEHAEQMVERQFSSIGAKQLLKNLPATLSYKWGSAEGKTDSTFSKRPTLAHDSMTLTRSAFTDSGLTPRQEQAVGNLLRVRTLVLQHIAKQDEEKTTDFLYAASKGDNAKVRQMLRQGFAVDSCDYDGRTALMLAASKGNEDVIHSLLAAGCDPQLSDNLGNSAMHEACKGAHDGVIDILKQHGAQLRMKPIDAASELCTLVFAGDLPLLKRYIAVGIEVDAGDYDQRTALHIAACEQNLSAVKLLVEEGIADLYVRDRWDKTPFEEAERVGAQHVARFLQARMDERPAVGARRRRD